MKVEIGQTIIVETEWGLPVEAKVEAITTHGHITAWRGDMKMCFYPDGKGKGRDCHSRIKGVK